MEVETVPNAPTTEKAATKAPDAKVDASNAEKSEKRSADAGGDGGAAGARQDAAAERKHKLKYGKQEREVTEQELISMAQKGWAADERFQTAAQKEKAIRDALEAANFDELIEKKTGKKALEYYKEKLKAEIRKATMTPDQRAEADARDRVEALKREEEGILTKRQQEKLEQQEAFYADQYDRELAEAVTKNGLPKTGPAVSRAVALAQKVVDMGLEPDWDLCVKEAKSQMQTEGKQLLEALDDAGILSFLGDDMARKISKALMSKGQPSFVKTKVEKGAAQDGFKQPAERKIVDLDEWTARKAAEFAK